MFKAKEYVKVRSLEEAYQLNQKRSNLIVGGMMWLKMEGNLKITAIDLSALPLDGIEETKEEFKIGCMCSLRTLETHEGLNSCFGGVFKECTRHIVGVQFRNGATAGGSIFGRYGFSDILTCMLALDSYAELYKGGMVSMEEFSKMPYDRDLLVRIIIKKDGRKPAYVSQRRSQTDFPLINCCVSKLEDTWHYSVGARPGKAMLLQSDRGEATEAVIKDVVDQFTFADNNRASGEYRKALAEVYLNRLAASIQGGEA